MPTAAALLRLRVPIVNCQTCVCAVRCRACCSRARTHPVRIQPSLPIRRIFAYCTIVCGPAFLLVPDPETRQQQQTNTRLSCHTTSAPTRVLPANSQGGQDTRLNSPPRSPLYPSVALDCFNAYFPLPDSDRKTERHTVDRWTNSTVQRRETEQCCCAKSTMQYRDQLAGFLQPIEALPCGSWMRSLLLLLSKAHVNLQVGNCMVPKGGVDPLLQLAIFGSLLQATGKQST